MFCHAIPSFTNHQESYHDDDDLDDVSFVMNNRCDNENARDVMMKEVKSFSSQSKILSSLSIMTHGTIFNDIPRRSNVRDHVSSWHCGSIDTSDNATVYGATNHPGTSNRGNLRIALQKRRLGATATDRTNNSSLQRFLAAGGSHCEHNRYYTRHRFPSKSKLSKPICQINHKGKDMDHPQYLQNTDYYKNNNFFDRSYYYDD